MADSEATPTENERGDNDKDVSEGGNESGFLFLQNCDVLVEAPLSGLNDNAEAFVDQWLPVSPQQARPDNVSSSTDGASPRVEHCPQCWLTLRGWKNESICQSLEVAGPRPPLFDGTVPHTKPDPETCSCKETLRQRTDAALLLGLAFHCQALGHIQIRSLRVCFQDTNGSNNELEREGLRRLRATILVTFDIPEILSHPAAGSVHGRRKSTSPRRRFVSNSAKPFPPSTQLLLSIMRSDWSFMKKLLRSPNALQASRQTRIHGQSLPYFPPKLSLEEVYSRIDGAGRSLDHLAGLLSPTRSTELSCFEGLPSEVIQCHIGVYLNAKSLDALRCTCKTLHSVLRGVVPGLKLRLYAHQVKSLSWMRFRETKPLTENNLSLNQHHKVGMGKSQEQEDVHRAVTGGATVLIRNRTPNQEFKSVRISQYNGDEVVVRSDNPLSRRVARGGLLCDDPGLGKTITVLSLILQTLGLSTELSRNPEENKSLSNSRGGGQEKDDDRIFLEYWREQSISEFRSRALTKLVNQFLRRSPEADVFYHPVDPISDGVPDYFDVITRPICFREVLQKISADDYGDSFEAFHSDVKLCFRNAMQYHPTEAPIHQAAARLERAFLDMVEEFKQGQVQAAKKSFGRASARPNSSVAALVEETNERKLKSALVNSSATLLVVPSVLLEHWQDQLRLYVDIKYCTAKVPIVFEYHGTARCGLRMEEITRQCQVEKDHYPFIFVDKTGTRKLPSPQFLAMFSIVITTTQRFTNEWKNGSFEEEMRQRESVAEIQEGLELRGSQERMDEACPLLKVNWLRMVVDEGHSMGRGKDSSSISFASWISSQRRWAMTGTPTRQTVSQSGLSSILNLMQYLKHGFFSRRQDGEAVWQNLITRGWNRGILSCFFRLQSLLSLLMVRHTKGDIEELQPPIYETTTLPMSTEEVKTYNTLVCAVQSNLLITSMEGKTSGAQDSLLHRSQAKHAREALRNVRLVCSGGTQVIPTVSQRFWNEFLRDFGLCNSSPERQLEMREYLHRATTAQVSPCACCGMLLTTLLVFPCGDLVCTECVNPASRSCIVCEQEFDVDLFQRLQPGMDYQWLHNVEQEAKKKKALVVSSRPQFAEREDDSSSGNLPVLEGGAGILAPANNERQRRRTRKPGDGHQCIYNPKYSDGKCDLCLKEHDMCNLLSGNRRCPTCFLEAEECPRDETKPFYVVNALLKLHHDNLERQAAVYSRMPEDGRTRPELRPLKAIVFSQFRKVLNMAGDRLLRQFGTACVAEYWGKYRKQELHKFIYDKECFCMLLGKDGSEGLDLSFVTHIFFLEEVWDKSLEQQAVARAWRMGAKGPVKVETLIAEDTVEQRMQGLEKNLGGNTMQVTADMQDMQNATEAGKSSEYQRAKLQFLLKGLRLVTDGTTNPLKAAGGGAKRKVEPIVSAPFLESAANRKPKRARVRFVDTK